MVMDTITAGILRVLAAGGKHWLYAGLTGCLIICGSLGHIELELLHNKQCSPSGVFIFLLKFASNPENESIEMIISAYVIHSSLLSSALVTTVVVSVTVVVGGLGH